MELALLAIGSIASLTLLVCFVIVVVKMFQNKRTGLAIASIVGLPCMIGHIIAIVVGWKNKSSWGLEKVMPLFTIAFIVSVVVVSFQIRNAVNEVAQERDTVNSEFEGELEMPEISQ